MTAGIERVVVVIPARNEGSTLAAGLASVQRAARHIHLPVTVVLVLDSCTDDSAEIAASFPDVLVVEGEFLSVGLARASGFSFAVASCAEDPEAVWFATTDADSAVPSGWLAEHLRAARDGADVYVGAVVPVLHDLDAERRRAWLRTHPPGATLGHVHGANLGMRGSAYLAAGGFTPLATGEDVELVARLHGLGLRFAESEANPVVTSSRLAGRARGGYATYLAELTVPLGSQL